MSFGSISLIATRTSLAFWVYFFCIVPVFSFSILIDVIQLKLCHSNFLLAAAVVPEFVSGLHKVAAVEGKSARFECEVSGQPKPDIQWSVHVDCSIVYSD